MSLDQLFSIAESARETTDWSAAFGEPQTVGEQTIIPVAKVTYGFGLGFGQGVAPTEEDQPADDEDAAQQTQSGEGGGTGGGARVTPVGTIVVSPDGVRFEPTIDLVKIFMAAFAVAGLFAFGATLRAVLGKR